MEFYPPISKDLLLKNLNHAKNFVDNNLDLFIVDQ